MDNNTKNLAICMASLAKALDLGGGRLTPSMMGMDVGTFLDMISRNGIEFKFTGYHRKD